MLKAMPLSLDREEGDPPDDVERHAVVKLLRLIDEHKLTLFDDEEAQALKQIAAYYMGLRAVGKLADGLRRILIWIGWAVAAYLMLRTGTTEWLKGLTK